MKNIFFFLFVSSSVAAQNEFEDWDKNYPLISIVELFTSEQLYVDSVENDLLGSDISTTYCRIGGYRFQGTFLGEKRKTRKSDIFSMLSVGKFYGSDLTVIQSATTSLSFDIEGNEYWLPIQQALLSAFQNEISAGDELILYCAFFNDHLRDELVNNLLISEFHLVQN